MTQARTPTGAGSQYLDSNQKPTDITWPAIANKNNTLQDGLQEVNYDIAAAATTLVEWVAPNNGYIAGFEFANGSVALDGTNDLRVQVLNKSNSDAELFDYGFGTNTAADAADAETAAVAAYAAVVAANPKAEAAATRFNKGDVLLFQASKDGAIGATNIRFKMRYQAAGRS